MKKPQQTAAWQKLAQLASEGFRLEPTSGSTLSPVTACGITLDLSRQRVTVLTRQALAALCDEVDLPQKAMELVAGLVINRTEDRPVLHPLLRQPTPATDTSIRQSLNAMHGFVDAVRTGHASARSIADHRYTDVLVIGIGGSALGPQLAVNALTRFADGPKIHFLSNIDGASFDDITATLSPATTLVVVISKTFTTEETTINADAARAWLAANVGSEAFPAQFVAVTANPAEAGARGYRPETTFTFPVGVGGRFSMWSTVGLPIALAVGFDRFREMLDGAFAMDQHFASAPFESNLPMQLAAYGVWNRNFQALTAHAVLPYAERLSLLPKHLQQLEMESNGKSVDLDGEPVTYATCPVIFGEAGTNGQHSFHQLLHQGTDAISSDVIIVREREGRSASQHQRLLANAFAQANALWRGNHTAGLAPWRIHMGGRPVSIIELTRLDPFHLGALIALYENKVFAQGVLWHINSFDQWGVELGKMIAKTLLASVPQTTDMPLTPLFSAAP
jgi:glucose-6-phosphate isomerase